MLGLLPKSTSEFAEIPEAGQRSVPLLHHFQRTLLTEENVRPMGGSDTRRFGEERILA